jgi:hypothetical protein
MNSQATREHAQLLRAEIQKLKLEELRYQHSASKKHYLKVQEHHNRLLRTIANLR